MRFRFTPVSVRAALSAVLAAGMLSACGSRTDRTLVRDALVWRARSAQEPPMTERGARVIAFARSQVGHKYCWGGTGPSCFDCSGLVNAAWRTVGVKVPRTSDQIAASLPELRLEDIRVGDILWWPGHVGLYAGGGWVIDALDARHGVVQRPATDPYRAFRPIAELTAVTPFAASAR